MACVDLCVGLVADGLGLGFKLFDPFGGITGQVVVGAQRRQRSRRTQYDKEREKTVNAHGILPFFSEKRWGHDNLIADLELSPTHGTARSFFPSGSKREGPGFSARNPRELSVLSL
jgi:hypothetical protein